VPQEARFAYRDSIFNQFGYTIAPFLMEFFGTFTLVFIIGASGAENNLADKSHRPIAIGFGLMAMIFMGGHISGGHYNPAVTLGILATCRGKIHPIKSLLYILTQVIAATLGALFVYQVTFPPYTFYASVESHHTNIQGAVIEAYITFILVSVVLNVATTKATGDNSFYGLSIGAVIIAGAYTVGGITGGAFNPAVGTGPMLARFFITREFYWSFWVYWVGPLGGALAAAGFFRLTNPKEYDARHQTEGIQNNIVDAGKGLLDETGNDEQLLRL
jgi:aquaporin Z